MHYRLQTVDSSSAYELWHLVLIIEKHYSKHNINVNTDFSTIKDMLDNNGYGIVMESMADYIACCIINFPGVTPYNIMNGIYNTRAELNSVAQINALEILPAYYTRVITGTILDYAIQTIPTHYTNIVLKLKEDCNIDRSLLQVFGFTFNTKLKTDYHTYDLYIKRR